MPLDSEGTDLARHAPVSLPPRGFEMDELQKHLETAVEGLGDDATAEEADAAKRAAVATALGDDQVPIDRNPARMDGFESVNVVDEATGLTSTTQVYVPDDAKPSQVRAVEAAAPGTDQVLGAKGKAVDAPADGTAE